MPEIGLHNLSPAPGSTKTRKRVGRRNEYRVHPRLRFRHPAEADQPIGKLLEIFS